MSAVFGKGDRIPPLVTLTAIFPDASLSATHWKSRVSQRVMNGSRRESPAPGGPAPTIPNPPDIPLIIFCFPPCGSGRG